MLDIPEKIESSLAAKSPRFTDVILTFIGKLDGQLQDLEDALARGDAKTLMQGAHWLRGSAGSVGFGSFTNPATELEEAAREYDLEAAAEVLELIKELKQRIVAPKLAETGTDQR